MRRMILTVLTLAATAAPTTTALAQPSGSLSHCCNQSSPQLSCSSSETHGNNDHSKCKTSYSPLDGKTSVCTKTVTSNGQVMYQASISETSTGLGGNVSCAGGQTLHASITKNIAQQQDTVELSANGRGLLFTGTLGTCEVTCVSPDPPQSAACLEVLSSKH